MRRRAFTLIELMVAMSLLIILGLLLLNVVRRTLATWQHTEQRAATYRTAREVLSLLREDLEAMYAGDGMTRDVIFLIDRDVQGRQRLRFVRKIKEEHKHPILRHAASETTAAGHDEYFTFRGDRDKKLRATGGLAEIIYCLSPTPSGQKLWRGIRSPIGGDGSFFDDANIDELTEIEAQCNIVSEDLLHFAIACWGYNAVAWDAPADAIHPAGGGASQLWDSTRTRLRDFYLHYQVYPPTHPKAVLPHKLRFSLVLSDYISTELREDLSETDLVCAVKDAGAFPNAEDTWRFLRIDDEWISYTRRTNNSFIELRRGLWGTKSTAHPAQRQVENIYYEDWDVEKQFPKTFHTWQETPVYSGIPMTIVVALPTNSTIP